MAASPNAETPTLAESLRAAVVAGEYLPGQRLVEAELCSRYGAGRSAVREALHLLAGDGLIELEPHRTARVRKITLEEAIEMAEVRAAVEVILARRAAALITEAEKQELLEIGARTRLAFETFDPVRYSEHNELLHRRICEIAQHKTAATLVLGLRIQLVRFQMRLSLQPGNPAETLAEHEDLIQAIISGGPDSAAREMAYHLDQAVQALRTLVEHAPNRPAATL